MAEVDHDTLMRFYELAIQEEHYFLDAHQARMAFYSKVILVLIVVSVFGVFMAHQWYEFAAMCVGPILIYAVSAMARDGCQRFYRRYLEAVSTRAKIEQDLGLTHPRPDVDLDEVPEAYWATEPIIAPRHVTSRKRHLSSEEFIRSNMRRGFHRWTDRLFRGVEMLSVAAFIGMLAVTVLEAIFWLEKP
jgi:hypothetical protein